MKKTTLFTIFLFFGVLASSSFAVEVNLFGPIQYTREEGKPYVFTDVFPGEVGIGTLIITNGTLSGTNRVSSAIIKVNGVEICDTNDFNLEVYNLEVPVNLLEDNTLSVELRSEVGSYLTIQINQEIEAEAGAVLTPEGGWIEVLDLESPLYGASAFFPEGSISEPQLISISLSDFASRLYGILPDDIEPVGVPAEFGPGGLAYSLQVYLTLTYYDNDNDGLIDGTSIRENNLQVIRIDDQGDVSYIPIENQDSVGNTVTFSTDHFSTYTVVSGSTCYLAEKWDMELEDEDDWEEASQEGDPPIDILPTGQIEWNYGGLNNHVRLYAFAQPTPQIIRIRQNSQHIPQEDIYIWRPYIYPAIDTPTHSFGICGGIYKDDLHGFEFGFAEGKAVDRLSTGAKDGEWLYWIVSRGNPSYEKIGIVPYGDYIEVKITIRKLAENKTNVRWYFNGELKAELEANYSGEKFHIYCGAEVNERYGDQFFLGREDANFDYVIHKKPCLQCDDYEFDMKWGEHGTGPGQFRVPRGVAVDSHDNFYVSDSGNHRIQKFDSNRNYILEWGSLGSGPGQFLSPMGIAVDSANNVYVADYGNYRVQKFDPNGVFIAEWQQSGMIYPMDVAIDSEDNVYVAPFYTGRIYKIDSCGELTYWPAYRNPISLAVDSDDNIHVVRYGYRNIQKYDSNGNLLTEWGDYGCEDGQMSHPVFIAADAVGNVYVMDYSQVSNKCTRVQKFDSSGEFIAKIGRGGIYDGEYRFVQGIGFDSEGNVYVVDTEYYRISKFKCIRR